MTEAIIQATFPDYKRIKTRKVAQLVFEVPLEMLHDTIAKLGGEPSMHEDTWCAIARLNMADASTREDELEIINTTSSNDPNVGLVVSGTTNLDTSLKPSREFNLAQKVGALCAKPEFFEFLKDFDTLHFSLPEPVPFIPEETAAIFVRAYCGVKSRSEIIIGSPAHDKWRELADGFDFWSSKR